MKKLISMITVLSIILSMTTGVVHAENTRDAFSHIKFSSADFLNWADDRVSEFENGADAVGGSAMGYWTFYQNVDFGEKTAGAFSINVARNMDSTGIINVYAVNGTPDYDVETFDIDGNGFFSSDTIDAELIGRCKVNKNTGGWGAENTFEFTTPLLTSVTGKHDIIITLSRFATSANQFGDISNFRFLEKSPFEKTNFIAADVLHKGFVLSEVLEKDTDGSMGAVNLVGDTNTDKYVVFNNMDFKDKGISYVNMAIASTGRYAHYAYVYLAPFGTADAGLEVVNGVPQLDGAVKIADIEVNEKNASGSWYQAKLYTAAVENGENYKGQYDVIVTFSGAGVGSFAWMNFNELSTVYKPFERLNFIQADVKTVANLNEYLETDTDGKPGTVNGVGGVDEGKYILFKNVDLGVKGVSTINMAIGAASGSHSGNANVYLAQGGTVPSDLRIVKGKPMLGNTEKIASVYVDSANTSGSWSKAKLYTTGTETNNLYAGCYDIIVTFSTVGIGNFFWMNFDSGDMTTGVMPIIGDGAASAVTKIIPGTYSAIMIYNKSQKVDGTIHFSVKNDNLTLVDDDIELKGRSTLYALPEIIEISATERYTITVTAVTGELEELCPSNIILLSDSLIQKAESFNASQYFDIDKISWAQDHYGSTTGDNSTVEFLVDFGKASIYELEYEYGSPNYATSIIMYIDDVPFNTHVIKYSGGWETRRKDSVRLTGPLEGIHKVKFQFVHHGFGNIYNIAFNKSGLICSEEYGSRFVTRTTLIDLEDTEAKTPAIITASYNADGKLLSVTSGDTTRTGSVVKNAANVKMGNDGYYIKTMLLDELQTLIPIGEYIKEDSTYSLDDKISAYEAFKPGEKFWSTNGFFKCADSSYKIGGTSNNTLIKVGNVDFGDETLVQSLTVNYATSMSGVVIKFYLDERTNENLIATFNAADRAGWDNFVDETIEVSKTISGIHDVIISYEGSKTNVSACDLNTLVFNK